MKSIKIFRMTGLLSLAVYLFGFTHRPGGEGFEVYLNNKLVIQQFHEKLKEVKNLQLSSNPANDVITVKYWNCGNLDKARTLSIKDDKDRIVKEWKFADAKSRNEAMQVKVSEIPGISKESANLKLNLYYTSAEIPKGRQLVALKVGEGNTASVTKK